MSDQNAEYERQIRDRDAAYGESIPEHWTAARDRRHLINEIDMLREALVFADGYWKLHGTIMADHYAEDAPLLPVILRAGCWPRSTHNDSSRGREVGGSENQIAPGQRVGNGTADPSRLPAQIDSFYDTFRDISDEIDEMRAGLASYAPPSTPRQFPDTTTASNPTPHPAQETPPAPGSGER